MKCQQRRANPRIKPRGTTYVAVMGVALIVGMLGLTAMQISRIETQNALVSDDMATARLLAQSAVAYGLAQVEASGDSWRSDFEHNVIVPNSTGEVLGPGSIRFKLWDEDGDLADDKADSAYLFGYGQSGEAVAVERVTIESRGEGLTCLESALTSDKTIDLKSGSSGTTTLLSDQTASSNEDIEMGDDILFDADAWAEGEIDGLTTGESLEGQSPAKELPGSDVFDYYIANGVSIDISKLPEDSGTRVLGYVVLSPASNPYGITSPEGVYVIDCQGERIILERIRIVGTLVLLNVGSGSGTSEVLLIEPVVSNYPALLVQGDFQFDMAGLYGVENLVELTAYENFNPVGTPYQGSEDSDILDTYPSKIAGLVYVEDTLTVIDNSTVEGCLVVGECEINSDKRLTANYSEEYMNNPPPGFRVGEGTGDSIEKGTWVRVAQ